MIISSRRSSSSSSSSSSRSLVLIAMIMIIVIIIIIMIMTIIIIIILLLIVTLPRLPPTHLEYSVVDSLAFGVRGLDLRGLAVTNVSRIVVVGGSACCILRGLEAPGGRRPRLRAWGG